MATTPHTAEKLFTTREVTALLDMKLLAMRDWIHDGIFPPPDKVGPHGAYLWRETTIAPWLQWRAGVIELRAKRAEIEKQSRELRELRETLEAPNREAWARRKNLDVAVAV
ncbi:AlpA family transcriptional regulator [Caballeronia novacaledonica]|uniref:Uncharacterized protein n=1 Tax=Caballeronia novacaledonica TaxID=1544861 RepID=A0AA37IF89_9BURK|nr:hypothetical protein [Caballeronia novacaledonica]GJH28159.1 hypothetical protein CBA19CS42_26605 [Caballeronia novacaledonica]